jgi:hypothetical protein
MIDKDKIIYAKQWMAKSDIKNIDSAISIMKNMEKLLRPISGTSFSISFKGENTILDNSKWVNCKNILEGLKLIKRR